MNFNLKRFGKAGCLAAALFIIFAIWLFFWIVEPPGRAESAYLRASFNACYRSVVAVQKSEATLRAFPDCITNLFLNPPGKDHIEFMPIADVDKITTNTILCRSRNRIKGRYMLLLGSGEITWINEINKSNVLEAP